MLRIQENGLSARVHLAPIPTGLSWWQRSMSCLSALPTGAEADRSLAAGIAVRCTNRKLLERDPSIPGRLKDALALTSPCRLLRPPAHRPGRLAELASICGTSERIRVVNPSDTGSSSAGVSDGHLRRGTHL